MKISCCRDMGTSRFSLSGCAPADFVPVPRPAVLWLDYEGRAPEPAVAKNAPVYPGMLLARHPEEGAGDLCCPALGVVSDAGAEGVLITVGTPAPPTSPTSPGKAGDAPAEPETPVTRPLDLNALHGGELVRALKERGIHTGPLTAACDTLIINGLNPDPGVLWAGSMFAHQADALQAGVALLRRLTPATNLVLAAEKTTKEIAADVKLADLDVRFVPAVYPFSLDPLLIKAVTGKESPRGVCVVGLHEIWKLGRTGLTGLPVTETALTLDGVNYLALLGTPARDVLDLAGITLNDGDALIFNGPLRGVAQSRPQAGVTADTYGICVVRGGDVPPLAGDAPCIACGECVRICPARIQPDLLSRYAELGRDDKCRDLHIEACMDCGLCAYACIARRPVLQYLRLARRRLGV